MTEAQKKAYLEDHLRYERVMLEFTLEKIRAPQDPSEWNAYYESFVVHARNLYEFLTNDDRKNARACDFVTDYSAQKSGPTKSMFPRMLQQVFHLGPDRPSDTEGKLRTADMEIFYSWLSSNFEDFVSQLPPSLAVHWNRQRPIFMRALVQGNAPSSSSSVVTMGSVVGLSQTSTTNAITVVSTPSITGDAPESDH